MKRLYMAVAAMVLMSISAFASHTRQDIVDTAVQAGSFNTLAQALKAADLVETLKGPGPLTVFAPTDEAFRKLPPGTLEVLLKPENKDQLRSILTYHVVSGRVTAADVVKLTSAKTVKGPGPFSVSTRSAAFRALARVLNDPAWTAVSTMSCRV